MKRPVTHRSRNKRLVDNLRFLIIGEPAAATRPGYHLNAPHRLRLKLMVKHRHKSISHRDQYNHLLRAQSEGGVETALTLR